MKDQKKLWEKLAKENPKYYIFTDKGKNISEKDFIESGKRDYKRLIKDDKLVDKKGIALEIGCGIGRILPFMANDFDCAFGVDISKEMIEQAIKRIGHIKNIGLIETNGTSIPLVDESVDFIFSYLVFQHFKTIEMVRKNFNESYRILKKGGLMKVLVRTDKVSLDSWWGGVKCDEKIAEEFKFKVIKKQKVKNYGLWLWLTK
jgi:ubiquinone/menaquinone biosynthesis C-methylase UbiE